VQVKAVVRRKKTGEFHEKRRGTSIPQRSFQICTLFTEDCHDFSPTAGENLKRRVHRTIKRREVADAQIMNLISKQSSGQAVRLPDRFGARVVSHVTMRSAANKNLAST
jgi:hypothetical protein